MEVFGAGVEIEFAQVGELSGIIVTGCFHVVAKDRLLAVLLHAHPGNSALADSVCFRHPFQSPL